MSRFEKLARLEGFIDELDKQKLHFSTEFQRKKRDHWGKEHEGFISFMEKVVGSDKHEAAFILDHFRRLYPSRTHLSV